MTSAQRPAVQDAPPLWFSLDAEAALRALEATATGLSSDDAKARLARVGPNLLPRPRGDSAFALLWRQIDNPLIWVLLASGVASMAVDPTGGFKNGVVILAVVALNTLIGFVQEFKAGRAIDSLSRMVPENVCALRDGRKAHLEAADLVPGDVVLLASGDRVPADMRLVAARNLHCDEAALTGESVPAQKSLQPVAADAGVGDRTCMVFGGTLVTYGTATAVVVETGASTQLGRISQLLGETTGLETPLTLALAKIAGQLTVAILAISLVMLGIGTWRTMAETGVQLVPALRETVIFAIALAVGAIPEGLPAIVTIALAIGVQRMAGRRAVVRRLPAVETLGSTTIICSDKTGTLTRNEMTVQEIWTPSSGSFSLSGVGYAPEGDLLRDGSALASTPDEVGDLLRAGALCNDATLERRDDVWSINGDPTEGALVVAAAKLGIDAAKVRERHARRDAIPFESEHQFMATLHATAPLAGTGASSDRAILVKGAPEVVIRRCASARGAALDAPAALREVERMAERGMRVLAFASKRVPAEWEKLDVDDVDGDLVLLGLQGMIDPPRPEAIEAIRHCHRAGITVKMITGDHPSTARAIGADLHLHTRSGELPPVIVGQRLAEMSDAELDEAVATTHVFARVAPEHKLRLVRALQRRGDVVAMTGDGVNDAPALKQANIGVAMGITGTSVAKEAAAIVLTDDNFASITAAVEEGRRVYDNLVKSLAFVLPTNLGLAMILMVAVALFPFDDVVRTVGGATTMVRELLLPMEPTQILWINLVATVALALPLAFETRERNVMQRPPRSPEEPVLSRFVIVRTFVAAVLMCGGATGLFYWEYVRELRLVGMPGHETLTQAIVLAEAQTLAVTTVIVFQIFYLLNCRSLRHSLRSLGIFSNRTIFVGIGSLLVLQAAYVYAPFMHAIFGSAPLSAIEWLLATVVGAAILPVITIEKWDRNRRAARRSRAA